MIRALFRLLPTGVRSTLWFAAFGSALCSSVVHGRTYGPYAIDFGNFRSLSIRVIDDAGIISPQLQTFDRSSPTLAANVRPLGLGQTQATFERVIQETGAGSPVPYFLGATVNALDNIDRHLAFDPGEIVGALVPPNLRNGAQLTLHLFSDRRAFERWRGQTVPAHSADAAYDPRSNVIGVFVDTRFLRYFGYQTGWTGYPPEYFVRELRLYVEQLFVRSISHEVVHFLQAQASSSLYALAPIREGMAVAVASELESRHEILMLVADMYSVGRDPHDMSRVDGRGRRCIEPQMRGVLNLSQVDRFASVRSAIEANPNLSIVDFLFARGRAGFYAGNLDLLESRYALSEVAIRFLASLGSEERAAWRRVASEAGRLGRPPDDNADKALLDRAFRAYAVRSIDPVEVAASASATSSVEARSRLTTCMETSPPTALIWGHIANMIEPGNPNVALEIGDIFSDSDFVSSDGQRAEGHSLAVLDYYLLAQQRLLALARREAGEEGAAGLRCTRDARPRYVFEFVRGNARLGERYAEIGDFETAIRHLECAIAVAGRELSSRPEQIVPLIVTVLNSEVRLHAYVLARAAGLERTRAVNDLVRDRNASTARLLLQMNPDLDSAEGRQQFVTSACVAQLLSLSIIDGELRQLQARLAPGRTMPQPDISLCGLQIS